MAHCDSYYFGFCTWYCCDQLGWVRDGWGNALDWAANAERDGLEVVGCPTEGSVVCYGPGNGYSDLGHVAIVLQTYDDGTFLVSEMNAVGWDVVDQRRSNTYGVRGFILAPGMTPCSRGGGGGGGGFDLGGLYNEWGGIQDYVNRIADDQINYMGTIRGWCQQLLSS